MATDASFWDKIAPKYATDPISDQQAYDYTLGRTISYLKPDHRALEMGCGTGSTALQLTPHVREIVATDISPGMINIAKAKDGPANIDFRVLTAEASAKLSEPFDVVMAHNLLHLVKNAEAIIADIFGMLPTGGIFISKTPCLADPSFGVKRFAIRAVIPLMQLIGKAPSTVRFLSHKDLESAMIAAGFEIIEAGNFPSVSRYVVARKR